MEFLGLGSHLESGRQDGCEDEVTCLPICFKLTPALLGSIHWRCPFSRIKNIPTPRVTLPVKMF